MSKIPSNTAAWKLFFQRALTQRLSTEEFTDFLPLLQRKHPLGAQPIADLFLAPTDDNDACLDPRAGRWVLILLAAKGVTVQGVLRSALAVSSFGNLVADTLPGEAENPKEKNAGAKSAAKVKRWSNSYTAEETLFYRLTKIISSATAPTNVQDAVELLVVCIKWMELIISASQSAQVLTLNLSPTQTSEMNAQYMALGTLVVAIVENGQVVQAISKGRVPKATRKDLAKVLATFVPLLLQTSPQNAARLEVFRSQTLVAIEPVDKKERAADKEIEDILEESMGTLGVEGMVIADMPSMNSRAGLYIYLNSLLVGRPLIDDNAIYAYLDNRYQGDIRQTIVDLILAAFDILANATYRNERAQSITILRSFLINKIPLLLVNLSATLFQPLTPEYCITEALSHVDTTVFPTLSNMFDESNNLFSDSVRSDFCFACCLHDLIAESRIEDLLGDVPMQSLPAGGRYLKNDLVQQCLSDPERTEGLIDELEHMDGNVGAVSQAIAEVIVRLCNNKETMSLKGLCSQLAKKPSSLDIMLLFEKPITILQPICELLDNWRYDEDQSEYQPVYEEFGSILLLVLSFAHRYNLSTVDLGIRTADSFVAKLLNQGHLSRAMDELTQTEQNHLDGWIKGLFDNESGGLGDELMSSCPPQDFYLLVPTLFHHIVLACSTKNLSDDGLKGGLEYLIEPFLLPSLIPGITWLSSHLWESRGDANAVLQILSALITSSTSISNNTEASQMLNAILNIIAKNLEHSLRWLQRAEPSRQDVEPLSKALRGNLGWERRGASDHTELEGWTATPGGGLITAIKQTINNLIQWGLNPGININPANYTHRQILVGVKMIGAKRVLHEIIEEVKIQTEAGHGAIILDVAAALVCAPDPASWEGNYQIDVLSASHIQPLQRRMNLREALKIEAENAPKVQKEDAFHAETVVRLYRKVEALLVLPQIPHDALGALNAEVDAMAGVELNALSGVGSVGGLGDADGLGGAMGMGLGGDLGMGDDHGDLMQSFLGGDGGHDLLDTFGAENMGDGMGF